jgi:hypothetical protein
MSHSSRILGCAMQHQLTGEAHVSRSTVASFIANLPELFCTSIDDVRTVVAIVEFSGGRYIQFWLDSWECCVVEVMSNRFSRDARDLTTSDESALKDMGWLEPSKDRRPNWYCEGSSRSDFVKLVVAVRRVVYSAFGEQPSGPVTVRTFEVRAHAQSTDEADVAARPHSPPTYRSSGSQALSPTLQRSMSEDRQSPDSAGCDPSKTCDSQSTMPRYGPELPIRH